MKKLYSNRAKPSSELKDYIDAYWEVENQTDKSIEIPIVPDGCIDIISKNGEIFLVGLMEIASVKTIEPNDHYIGIRFKPSAVSLLFEENMSVFNDKMVDFKTIEPLLYAKLYEVFSNDNALFDKLGILFEGYFRGQRLDKRVDLAIEEIELHSGNISIEQLCQKVELSQKQLGRLFVAKVGLTPKKFARVIRFYHTHRYLTQEGLSDLCAKMIELGYYDQAHFNREYKMLTGLNPSSKLMSIFYNT